jgi:cytochrome oxidase assembly protein ShyY1
MPRFLFTRRWIKLLVFALVVAGVCVRLGFWQLQRLHDVRVFNAAIEAGMHAPPVPIETVLRSAPGASSAAFRRVSATGTYDTAHEVILYGRSLSNDQPGNHVLTPLRLADGTAVIVDRGWVPLAMATPPISEAAPPAGAVTVVGVLYGSETSSQGPPVTTLRQVDLPRLRAQLPYPIAPLFLKLQSQQPAQAGPLPTPEPPPPLDEGPHLDYAFQWFSFATIALLGYGLLAVKESRRLHSESADARAGDVSGRRG